jgi:hypothetical protein
MKAADPSDTARVELLLAELRLPAIKQVWASLAAQADNEGWPAARFLAALAEHELAERTLRRIKAISPKPGCRRLSPGVAAAIGIEIGGAIVRVRAGIELGLLGKVLRLLKAMK